MSGVVPEPSNWLLSLAHLIGLVFLIGLYFFGVWSRSYVMPADNAMPFKHQLVAAIPVGLVTMGLYAKNAFPAMAQAPHTIVFDASITMGYAIFLGMLSRESLEKLLQTARKISFSGERSDDEKQE